MKRILWIAGLVIAVAVVMSRLGYNLTVGGLTMGQDDFERLRQSGQRRHFIVVGGCVLDRNTPPELVNETVESLVVIGGFVADKEIYATLGDRLKIVGGGTAREG